MNFYQCQFVLIVVESIHGHTCLIKYSATLLRFLELIFNLFLRIIYYIYIRLKDSIYFLDCKFLVDEVMDI